MEISNDTRIKVGVRIRPLLEMERQQNIRNSRLMVDQTESEIRVMHEDYKTLKSFKFDHVCDENISQNEVYDKLELDNLMNKVLEGFHATIFAYGQTGSGKTYTMEGYKYEVRDKLPRPIIDPASEKIGVIPRVIFSLFDKIKSLSKTNGKVYTVYVSFLEIYNERIYDLLNPGQLLKSNSINPGLRLRWTKKDEFMVENLYIFECKTPQEVLNHFHSGIKNRIIASHKMNMSSSRSHTILTLKIEQYSPTTGNSTIINSRLELVDLAGSERLSIMSNDNNSAKLAKETIEINKSLFTLRQVITMVSDIKNGYVSLQDGNVHVPYRESKLTCLLKHSIGGNAYTLMIACLAPGDNCIDENVSTLTYATKTSGITNAPTRNEDPKTQLINSLKNRISCMAEELVRANEHIEFLSVVANERAMKFGMEYISPDEAMTTHYGTITDQIHRQVVQKSRQQHAGHSPEPSKKTTGGMISNGGTKNNGTVLAETLQRIANTTALETISQNLQKLNSHMEKSNKSSGDKGPGSSFLTERLVDSVNMVRDLLHSNKEMREIVDKLTKGNEEQEFEITGLQKENEELREKVSILESLVTDESELGPSRYEWLQKLLASERSGGVSTKVDLAGEILKLKQEKRSLEARVRQLEVDNMVLQNKVSPSRAAGEPMRAINQLSIKSGLNGSTLGSPTGFPTRNMNPQTLMMGVRSEFEMAENTTNFGRKTLGRGRVKLSGLAFPPTLEAQQTRFATIPSLPQSMVHNQQQSKRGSPSPHDYFMSQINDTRDDSLPFLVENLGRRPQKYQRDNSFY